MKYFANIKTAEELRKVYRELCLTLHPDKGGNEEEFKAMQAEFESLKAAFMNGTAGTSHTYTNAHTETAEERRQREEEERRQREEWARWEEERRKEREEEERRERERKAKARPIYEARCKKWASIMEDLTPYMEAERKAHEAHGWRSKEYKKATCATNAARRRNLLKMAQTAFKGVKFSLKYDKGWGGGYTVYWTDGPSVKEFEEKTDYNLFVSYWDTFDGMTDCAGFEKADFTDFANKYSGKSGEVGHDRTISDENRRKMADVLKRLSKDFTDETAKERYGLNPWEDNKAFLNGDKLREFFRIFGTDYDKIKDGELSRAENSCYTLATWINKLSEYVTLKTDTEKKQEKPAEFTPQYGAALRALFNLAGGRDAAFWLWDSKKREAKEITLNELIESLENGTRVRYGKRHQYTDGEGKAKSVSFWGVSNGGYKTQAARAAKWAAAGYTIEGSGKNSTYNDVEICGITPETAAALRADLANIERQREAWEASQKAGNAKKATENAHSRTKADKTTNNTPGNEDRQNARNDADTPDMSEAPADGLQLVEIAGGVAVVGDSRTTYKNRKAIKAHGARWNRDAQQWQATDPADVATLRAWFGMSDTDKTNDNESDTAAQNAPGSTQTGEAGDTTTGTPESDHGAQDTPESESTGNAAPAADLSPLVEAFANLFRIIADTIQEAKKYEGVTIPADTLERWRTETATGTKCAAAQLSEVCACLACLTPDSRREFDALGVIFWTLSDQLARGFSPDTIAPATDYARGQLFDLISRTQHPNQAAAVREATNRRDAA